MTVRNRELWAVAAAALAIGFSGCSHQDARPAASAGAAQGVPVTVAKAELRDFPDRVKTIGSVESVASVMLKPQVSGQLMEAKFKEGDEVKAGDLLLVIDPRPFQAALHEAEANLVRSQAMAADASRVAEQMEEASKTRAASVRETENAQAMAHAAQATELGAQAELERAKLNLEYCSIKAPIGGRIGTLVTKPGNILKENETELVQINQIVPINVVFAVPEASLSTIRDQQAREPMAVEAIAPSETIAPARGQLTFLDNKVDAATGTIRLRATFPNDDRRLWPGQFVNATMTLGVQRGAVVVPAQAVQNSQRGSYVFVVANGAVEERLVKVARNDERIAVIAEGLKGDETVVTDGQLRLVPGAKVQVMEEAKTAADSTDAPAAGAKG